MRRLLAAAALCTLLLTGCGDATDNPAPSDPTPSQSQDAEPTTADTEKVTEADPEAGTKASTATSDAGTAPANPTTASNPTTTPTEEQAVNSAPAAPVRPADSGCTGDELSQDILGFTGGVSVFFCDGDWAYASYPNAPGAPEFIAERVDGRWFNAVALGDPVCRDDLLARNAPPSIAKLLPPCDGSAPPTAAPTTAPPTQPGGPCVITTQEYGDTHAELVEVTCAEAAADWELAEANAEPSWTIPWVTPSGWECYVTPYDPTSAAAGSCYGPDGSAYFTLFLP